jgi:uncharacterized membrane protein YobD (UPF0266 family)
MTYREVRDAIIFLVAIALIIYEAILHEGPERWGLLTLYATMLGLPIVLRHDERNGSTPPRPRRAEEADR